MLRSSPLAYLLFAIATVHVVAGALLADAESGTLVVAGASATMRWIATQLLGASIAGYAVASLATFGIAVPRSWRAPGAALGGASSLLLMSLLWRGGAWPLYLAGLDLIVIVIVAAAGRSTLEAEPRAETVRHRRFAS